MGTQIMAISGGVPISVASSAYSKGPFTNTSSNSTKFARLQNSQPRSMNNLDMGGNEYTPSMGRGRGSIPGRRKYIEIDKSNLPSLPIYQLLRAFNL